MATVAKANFCSAPRAVRPRAVVAARAAVTGGEAPDMDKRNVMNLLLAGATALPVAGLAVPFISFFVPPGYVPPLHATRNPSPQHLRELAGSRSSACGRAHHAALRAALGVIALLTLVALASVCQSPPSSRIACQSYALKR